MPIRTWIENGVTFREMTENVVVQELLEALKTILDHPDFKKGMPTLWDMRNASFTELSKNDLYKLRDFICCNAERRGSNFKVAYVASRDLEYGVSRMLESVLQANPSCSRKTFRSMDDAVEWVKAPLVDGWKADE